MPHLLAIFLMRLFTISSEPILNSRLSVLNASCRLIICIGMSINLIWNGTPVFWRFDTIHDALFISMMLSVVRFLMSVNEIPVQQPNRNRSLANAKLGLSSLIVHRKRVSRYLPVIVGCGDDVFQRYGVYTHG